MNNGPNSTIPSGVNNLNIGKNTGKSTSTNTGGSKSPAKKPTGSLGLG